MKGLFSEDSTLFQLLYMLADMMILSLLWLVGCIPIVTIGASTTALYSCVMKRRKEDGISCFRDFWAAFKSNFAQGTILWGVVALLLVTLAADIYLVFFTGLVAGSVIALVVLLAVALVVLLAVSYVFPLQSFFVNTVGQTLKNAVLLSIMYLPVSVVIMFLNLVPLLVWLVVPDFFFRSMFLWVTLSPGVIAYINSGMFQRIFQRHITKESET